LATTLLAGALCAQQTIVSPIQNTNVEGNGANAYPITSNLVPRYMAVHSDIGGTPKIIRQLAYRRNGNSTPSPGTRTLDVEVWAGHSRDYDKVTYVFAENWIIPPMNVLPRQMLNIGPCNAPAMSPEPFELLFPFTTPFPYVGNLSFGYELIVYSNISNGLSASHDSETVTAVTGAGSVSTGAGCNAAGKTVPMSLSFRQWDNAGTLEFGGNVVNGPANAPTILALGSSNPNLAVPGLCGSIFTNLLLLLGVGATDAMGELRENATTTTTAYPAARLTFTMPNTLAGATIYAQAHSIDLGRTDPIAVCNSNGASLSVMSPSSVTPVKSTRIYTFTLQGPAYPHGTPLAGANVSWAAVTEFTY
jgi:hypothetical protein